jgi:hypothetical protein
MSIENEVKETFRNKRIEKMYRKQFQSQMAFPTFSFEGYSH